MDKKRLVFQCPILTQSGYGARARDIAKCLLNLDNYHLYFIPTNWGSTPWTGLDENSDFGKEVKKRIITKVDFQPDVFIQHTIPSEYHNPGKYNIGITAGIETNLAPASWIEGCNKMDMVIGSSNHSINILKHSSYQKTHKHTGAIEGFIKLNTEVELEVLHEGIDVELYKSVVTSEDSISEYLNNIDETFCYLFVGHWLNGNPLHDRKDIHGLIRVFVDTFRKTPSDKQPALILKTSRGPYSQTDLEETRKRIREALSGEDMKDIPSVYLLYGDLTDTEMISLYKHPKIRSMVSFTKGEGYGRPLAEFALTGKPVVSTAWSGHVDFLDPNHSVLLPGKLQDIDPSVYNDWFIKGAKWFYPDYTAASDTLRDIYKHYKKHIDRSKPQRSIIKNQFSLEKMESRLEEILDKVPNSKEKVSVNTFRPNLPDFK
jgi:hypothetical protein